MSQTNVKGINKHTLLRLWLIAIITCGLLMFAAFYQTGSHIKSLESFENNNLSELQQKSVHLEKLLMIMGYGGLIHHYNQYIITQDQSSYQLVQQDFKQFDRLIAKLKKLPLSSQEQRSIDVLSSTIKQYRDSLAVIQQLIADKRKVETIYKLTAIDDNGAIQALNFLENLWQNNIISEQHFQQQHREGYINLIQQQILITVIFFIAAIGSIVLTLHYNKRLKEQAEHLKSVLETAVDGIITINTKGEIQSFNTAAQRMFGYTEPEVLHRNVNMLMPNEYARDHDKFIHNYIDSGQSKVIGIGRKVEGLKKDGRTFPLDLAVSEAASNGQKIFTGFTRDLTELQHTIDELTINSQVIDASPDLIAIVSASHRIIRVNHKFAEALKISAKQLQGQRLKDVLGKYHNPQRIEEEIEQCLNGNKLAGAIELRIDNDIYDTCYTPLNHQEKITTIAYIAHNITALRNSSKDLAHSLVRLDLATRSGGIGIWQWDITNNTLEWDKRMYQLYGLEPSSDIEPYQTWESALHPDDLQSTIDSLQLAIHNQDNFNANFRIFLPDKKIRYIKASGKLFKDKENDILYMYGVNTDISASTEQQQALVDAREQALEASKAKSEFLSAMSHELRTPLNAILGFCQLLNVDRQNPLNERQLEQVSYIKKGGEHLLKLINEILDLAKIESGNLSLSLENVNPKDIIDDCMQLSNSLTHKLNIQLIDQSEQQPPLIFTDYLRTKQALLNLLSNAIKYNQENGKVWLSTQLNDDHLRISVKDTGKGIDKNKQDDLFKPFSRIDEEQSEIEGTGIGLSLTKKLVQEMNGKIGFESAANQGSTFWLEFPIVANDNQQPSTNSHHNEIVELTPQIEARQLLYVEDNPSNLALMTAIVKSLANIQMISAHNAELGIALAQEHQPDVIILDINLPGMNGFDALQQLKKEDKTKHIPVLALSADAMASSVNKGLKLGFEEYLTKPINVVKLTTTLNQILEQSPEQ